MVCISFSYREVRTELPPSPFISELHFQTDHCCRDLLRNSSPILWKQDGHPFLGTGELIKLVAVVQYTHTLLLISSIRLCWKAAARFFAALLFVRTDLMSVDLFHCCTCCKSLRVKRSISNAHCKFKLSNTIKCVFFFFVVFLQLCFLFLMEIQHFHHFKYLIFKFIASRLSFLLHICCTSGDEKCSSSRNNLLTL